LFSTASIENKKAKSSIAKLSVLKKEISPIKILRYPEKVTKKVVSKLDALLSKINKRNDFHGSLLVAKKGKIIYNNQVGTSDFRKKEPLNEHSVFQLASVSKQFTAAAIMILHEKKLLKLTDTVNIFFPKFPYENVTIKNLLNHTAGLPKYFWLAEHKWKKQQAPTNSEMMSLLEDSKVQRFFKPGRNFDYSNTGYLVLASIIEKVSGVSFQDFVKQNIFEPLGMKNSYVYSYQNDSISNNQINGYRLHRGWRHLKIGSTINDAIVGDKNVYSTAEDLYKWIEGLNNEKLFSKESLALMYTKGETVYGKEIPYGFGFRIKTDKENKIYHHGKWNGFRTGLTQYIEDDLVVIVLEHTSYNGIAALNKRVKSIVAKNFKG
jgi:CubicO group peptidase (beta-lactamase class C family)